MAIGGMEILVLLAVVVVIVVIGVIVVLAVMAGTKKHAPAPPEVQIEVERELQEIDSLLAAGKITQSEHEDRRKRILDKL